MPSSSENQSMTKSQKRHARRKSRREQKQEQQRQHSKAYTIHEDHFAISEENDPTLLELYGLKMCIPNPKFTTLTLNTDLHFDDIDKQWFDSMLEDDIDCIRKPRPTDKPDASYEVDMTSFTTVRKHKSTTC